MTLVLGVGNKARHGKDTVAEALVDHYTHQQNAFLKHLGSTLNVPTVKQFRFAEALYDECRKLHGMKEKDAPLLQKVGAARRAENPNYWIDKVFSQMGNVDIAVISDVRYLNEAAAVKKIGGYLLNVTRLNPDGTIYIADDRPANHPSEIELDGYAWDFYIKAYSGEAALVADQAITIVEYLRGLND
jgi:hypothetical protein